MSKQGDTYMYMDRVFSVYCIAVAPSPSVQAVTSNTTGYERKHSLSVIFTISQSTRNTP